jgi:molecular chaperone DnaJ
MSTDYYKILNVSKNASQDEIKQSYKKLAREFHPDKNNNTTKEKFQEIQNAYETLSDPEKRQQYDNPQPDFGSMFGGGGGGFPFEFGNMFNMGGMNRGGGVSKKPNLQHICKITLKDVYTGILKRFNIKRDIQCNKCTKNCTQCNGTGMSVQRIQVGPFMQIVQNKCANCNAGKVRNISLRCSDCDSKGFKNEIKLIEIDIPKGVENNKIYTYEEWGTQPSRENEVAGDLLVIIQIEEDKNFKRNGLNLIYETQISLKESIVGKIISIPHFKENIDINISNFGVINPNKFYNMDDLGLLDSYNNKGKLILKFNISYPDKKLFNTNEIKILNECFSKVNL